MTPDRLLAMVLIASLVLHGCGDRQEDDDDDDETDDTADTGGTENDTDDTDSDTDDTDDTDGTDADTDDTDADTSGTDGTEPSDVDADGWTAAEGDCDDSDAAVYPGASEICDGTTDHDCDGTVDEGCMSSSAAAIRFEAEAADEGAGSALSVGDLNGDGIDDLAMSAPKVDGAGSIRGRVYVWNGPLSAGTFHIGDGDGTINGTANADRFGRQVTIIQDLNGDGYGELLASSYSANSEALDLGWEGPGAGSVSLLHGPVSGTLDMSVGLLLAGEQSNEELGNYEIDAPGDMTGDGFVDLIIGAPDTDLPDPGCGSMFIFAGPITGALDRSEATAVLHGGYSDFFGYNRANGDFDGDGIVDLLVGGTWSEEAWLYLGPLTGEYALRDADATVQGPGRNEYFGDDVGTGDWNNDGILDWAIGVSHDQTAGPDAGSALVLFGPVSGTVSSTAADVFILGTADTTRLGDRYQRMLAADLDLDGHDELLMGARFQTTSVGADTGMVAVFSQLTAGSITPDDADLKLLGTTADDQFGTSLDVGDVDHDGLPDIVAGAYHAGTGGEVYATLGWQF